MKMSTKHKAKHQLECLRLSDGSDDSEYYSFDSDMENNDEFLESDASHTKRNVNFSKRLSPNDIENIDKSLDLYDKVSLIYLLYNNPHTALQQIILLIRNAKLNVIEEWYIYERKSNSKWQNKLLEALCITQNYEILRKLGFNKEDMKLAYLPLQEVSLSVNLVRKCCYRVCEDFVSCTRDLFLKEIHTDFRRNNRNYIPSEDRDSYNPDFLEMYFLYLESENYISMNNVSNLTKIFKYMDLPNLHDKFETLHDKINGKYTVDKTPGNPHISSNDLELTNKVEENSTENVNDIYDINKDFPGVLLIINNEDFYTEFREDLQDRLPKTDLKLESRTGTEADKRKLEETFTKFGFKIIIKDNTIHDNMLDEIRNVVENFKHSTLFVAILSHGDEGVVYAANSVAVEITEIQKVMCDTRLSGKPKVLLLQSCQGSECQKLDADLEIDGPSKKYVPPKTTDMLTFRATIKGFGAVRHRKTGSWFIQALCKVIEEHPSCHFEEICTKVIKEVSNIVWDRNKCMVPLKESTFTKSLYLKRG